MVVTVMAAVLAAMEQSGGGYKRATGSWAGIGRGSSELCCAATRASRRCLLCLASKWLVNDASSLVTNLLPQTPAHQPGGPNDIHALTYLAVPVSKPVLLPCEHLIEQESCCHNNPVHYCPESGAHPRPCALNLDIVDRPGAPFSPAAHSALRRVARQPRRVLDPRVAVRPQGVFTVPT